MHANVCSVGVWHTSRMCRDKPHDDGKSTIYQRFTRQHKRFYRQESIDADKKAWKEVAVFYKVRKWGCKSFFCIICGAVGSGWRYSCQFLTPLKCLSCLIYRQFLVCKLSTFNSLNPLEISVMKTLIIHEIFHPLNLHFLSSGNI